MDVHKDPGDRLMTFAEVFKSPNDVLQMSAGAVAFGLIGYLDANKNPHSGEFIPFNMFNMEGSDLIGFTGQHEAALRRKVYTVFMEALNWLENEGFIAHGFSDANTTVYLITRSGYEFLGLGSFAGYTSSKLLPVAILDPVLASKCRQQYVMGEYDVAVFQAFKEVEIRMRKAAGITDTGILGAKLARQAFGNNGPLTVQTDPPGEQDAARDLMAGALGSFKNPSSHRDVNYDDPAEVATLILFANQLLRIIDARARNTETEGA